MRRYVAFLRAVNVGKRRVAMAQLREEFETLGYSDVSTYINSGNVIFSAAGRSADLTRAIEERLAKAFGFEIPTFLRTDTQVAAMAARMPFGDVPDGHTHMVVLLRKAPTAAVKRAVEAASNDTDTLVVDGAEVHWLIRGKLGDSTLGRKEWDALGLPLGTSRNATMLAKLAAKLA